MCIGNYIYFDGGFGKKMSKLKCERIFFIKMCWYKNSVYVNVVCFISVFIVYFKSWYEIWYD